MKNLNEDAKVKKKNTPMNCTHLKMNKKRIEMVNHRKCITTIWQIDRMDSMQYLYIQCITTYQHRCHDGHMETMRKKATSKKDSESE